MHIQQQLNWYYGRNEAKKHEIELDSLEMLYVTQ